MGLCEAGLRQLALYDPNPATLQLLHNRLATHFPHVHLVDLPATLAGLDLLVNGSPAGMAGFEPLPLPQTLLETLPLSTHVADVVTAPIITRSSPSPGIAAARSRPGRRWRWRR